MSRLTEKLQMAGGVAKRVSDALEREADILLARETELTRKAEQAFAPHHELMAQHGRDLNELEDAIKLVQNSNPLEDSEPARRSSEVQKQ